MEDFPATFPGYYWILILLLILWDGTWRIIAMWKAARANKLGWFIALGIISSIGILPIIDLLVVHKKEQESIHTAP